jgi:hypothetical protein
VGADLHRRCDATVVNVRRFAQDHEEQGQAGIEPASPWQALRGELLRNST